MIISNCDDSRRIPHTLVVGVCQGSSFDSKYELKDVLNKFLNNYGIKLIDLDLANEFGESSDEVYIQSEPVNIVEVHGGYYPHGIIPGIKLG